MDFITLAIAIIVFITIVVGFVVGNLFPILRPMMTYDDEFGRKKEKEAEIESKRGAPPVQASVPISSDGVPPQKPEYLKMVQITRLLRDTEQYKLHVELDGKLYPDTENMDDEQKNVLAHTLTELWTWIDDDLPKAAPPAPVVKKTAQPPVKVMSGSLPKLVDDGAEKTVEPVEMTLNPLKLMANAVQASAQPAPKSRNVAEEVNSILQAKLIGTSFEDQEVEIAMTIKGTLAFMADGESYEFMDEIENLEIRAIMQQAVQEWDQSSET